MRVLGGNYLKKLVSIVAILFWTGTLVACQPRVHSQNNTPASSTSPDASTGQQSITVATDPTLPPFASDSNGHITGFDIALIQDIAKLENLKIEPIEPIQFTGLIPAVQTGHADVALAGITIEQSRMDSVQFSNAYYKSGLSILVKNGSPIHRFGDLWGRVVATKKGTSSSAILTKNGIKNMKEYANIEDAYKDLANDGADAVLFDNPVNLYYMNEHPGYKVVGGLLSNEFYGMAVSKNNPALLAKLNDGLQKIQDNGEYAALFDTYFGSVKSGLVQGVMSPTSVAIKDK